MAAFKYGTHRVRRLHVILAQIPLTARPPEPRIEAEAFTVGEAVGAPPTSAIAGAGLFMAVNGATFTGFGGGESVS